MGEKLNPEQSVAFEDDELNETLLLEIDSHYLKDIDDQRKKGEFDIKGYFEAVEEAKEKFLQENKGDEELSEFVEMYFRNVLILETDYQREKNTKNLEKNLAIDNAAWQIGIAEYYQTYKEDPTTLPIINSFLSRYKKTGELLGFDEEGIDGNIRGVRGLIAAMNALDKAGHHTVLPTAEQDAEEGIDLFSVDIKSHAYYTWQIKTSGSRQTVFTSQAEPNFNSYDNELKDFDRSVGKLARATKKLEGLSGHTIKPLCCIIPESGINEDLNLNRRTFTDFTNSVEGGKYAARI